MLLAAVPDLAMTGRAAHRGGGESAQSRSIRRRAAHFIRVAPTPTERCRVERPMLKPVRDGGEVACHAVEEDRL
jgi:hypothetical protein